MRARTDQQILYLHHEDVPAYSKGKSVVRNTYFWALRSIADQARYDQDWEFADLVWPALTRMLESFMASGYLPYRATNLEFDLDQPIPEVLRPVSTWADHRDWLEDGGQAEEPRS